MFSFYFIKASFDCLRGFQSTSLKFFFFLHTSFFFFFAHKLKVCVFFTRALALNANCKLNEKGNDAGDNWRDGKPLRVVRSYKGKKHSKYAPEEGIRWYIILFPVFSYILQLNIFSNEYVKTRHCYNHISLLSAPSKKKNNNKFFFCSLIMFYFRSSFVFVFSGMTEFIKCASTGWRREKVASRSCVTSSEETIRFLPLGLKKAKKE